MFIGRTDVEAETTILWPPDVKSWLIGKDPDAGKDWGQEKGPTEHELAGWHHWLNGHGFGWTPGVGDEQGGLECYSSWVCKESDMTEWLNWTERVSPSSAARNITNLISVLIIWWYSSVDGLLCFWKRVFAMTSVFSWQNCISLCPASFCTPSSNLPEISLHCFLSLHSNPLWWKEHLFLVSSRQGIADFDRTIPHRCL